MGKTYTVEEWFEVTDLTQPKKDKIKIRDYHSVFIKHSHVYR